MLRRLIHLSAICLLVTLGFTNTGIAQATFAIVTGTVRDQSGAVVVNAEVQLLNIGTGHTLSLKTDSAGRYELNNLRMGSYRLSVRSAGFAVGARAITLRRVGNYPEDFTLVPGVIESSITVTAGKGNARLAADTPQVVAVVDATKIEERRPLSTSRAIERTPNLTAVIANPVLERPRLRGLASNRVLILLDGERLNNMRSDPTSGVSPGVVAVTQLESIEVLSGTGSSLYGSDAMAGVINLVTAAAQTDGKAAHFGLRFDGDLHSNGLQRRGTGTINWNRPKFAFRLSGSLFRQSNYHSGNQAIPLEQVVQFGRLVTDMANVVGNGVGRTYAVWNLPAGAEIRNGQANGFDSRIDVWFLPGKSQSLRYRQLNGQDKNLGFSFIAPPTDQRTQFNSFRRLDKYGLRYESRELTKWFPRFAASFYRQKYSFPDDTITSPILNGSSWSLTSDPNTPGSLIPVLTGNRSVFTSGNLSENKNSITTYGIDVQATFAPAVSTMLTTGVSYLRESSADEFSRLDFVAPFRVISGRASNPNSVYRNWGWFNLLEHEPTRWLRFTGGLRVDNWHTEAQVTRGFPLGVESSLLDLSFAQLLANPGAINAQGAAGIIDLVKGVRGITTSRTVVTGNVGVVVRLPQGINPYFRWGNSYREPGITERYLLRDFGDSTFSVLVIPNTTLKPERGREYDAGVKIQRAKWNASFGFFNNDLKDFIGSAFGPPLFVPPDPAQGINPISPFFPFHGVLYVQRTNTARARIRGFEGGAETSLALGHVGTITPFSTFGWLKGSNLAPDENTLKLLAQFYNRADTPVPLSGSAVAAPLSSITPFRTISGARFDDFKRSWFGEYEVRYQARVTRADPLDLSAAIATQYGTVASLNSFAVQSLRGGYTVRRESYRMLFTFGVENLTNRLYFEHFQTAPAPGRSMVVGTTFELFRTK
ncbi:MAG TPA: TonB-dependent receptor [Pyrinomonadaceae bacterium]|jgi:outer membrane receptor protein involved in Fe transport|nr:TonB-dependent receptor [Pyrinomonadaceae bacterium]